MRDEDKREPAEEKQAPADPQEDEERRDSPVRLERAIPPREALERR